MLRRKELRGFWKYVKSCVKILWIWRKLRAETLEIQYNCGPRGLKPRDNNVEVKYDRDCGKNRSVGGSKKRTSANTVEEQTADEHLFSIAESTDLHLWQQT